MLHHRTRPQAQHGAHLPVEEVGADELRHDRIEVRRPRVGKLKLRPSVVGAARRPYLACGPWQFEAGPLHGVVAVHVVHVVPAEEARHELAVRPVPPAHVPARRTGIRVSASLEPFSRNLSAPLSYGVRSRMTGKLPSTLGRYTSARSTTPSRIAASTLDSSVILYMAGEGLRVHGRRRGYAQRGSLGSQRRNSGVPAEASSSRVRNHLSAHRSGSWSSLSGFDRLRAMNPGEPRAASRLPHRVVAQVEAPSDGIGNIFQ